MVDDVVNYTGSTHYTNAKATDAKTCKGGEAEVTQICKGAKHPYHLIHTESGCTVYGWVNEADVKAVSSSSGSSTTSEKKATDAAQSFDKSIAGTYKTTANLNMRNGAGTSKSIMVTLPKGTKVQNYGYYSPPNLPSSLSKKILTLHLIRRNTEIDTIPLLSATIRQTQNLRLSRKKSITWNWLLPL